MFAPNYRCSPNDRFFEINEVCFLAVSKSRSPLAKHLDYNDDRDTPVSHRQMWAARGSGSPASRNSVFLLQIVSWYIFCD